MTRSPNFNAAKKVLQQIRKCCDCQESVADSKKVLQVSKKVHGCQESAAARAITGLYLKCNETVFFLSFLIEFCE